MGVKIKKRNGGWWVFVNYHGRRKAKKVGTEKAAKEVAAKIQAKLALGDLSCLEKPKPEAIEPTFEDYANQWLELNPNGCKQSTINFYRDYQKRYINPRFGARKLSGITRSDIKVLLADLGEKKLSRNTIRLALASLRGVLTTAVEDGVLALNPASRLGRFTSSEKPENKAEAMESNEVERFLNAARDYCPEIYPLFLVAVRAGLPQGEILGLTWGNIQFGNDENDPNRFIVVRRRWYRGTFSTPKGGKARRVDMSRDLRRALLELKDKQLLEAFTRGQESISDDLLFPGGDDGHPISVRTLVEKYYLPVLDKAGLRRFRFHDLRHTFGSLLIQAGAPLPYVSEQMGHASIQITADTYVHLTPGRNVGWVDKLATLSTAQPDATQAQPEVGEQAREFVSDWCERGDSNPHGFTRQILSLNSAVDSKEHQSLSSAESGKVLQNPQPPRNQDSSAERQKTKDDP
jgi:integrase